MKAKIVTGPRLIGLLLLAALAVAIVMAVRKPPVAVELAAVTRGPMAETVDDLGETRVKDLYVVSAPVTGKLLRVPLKAGDRVIAGRTLLGRIQPLEPGPLDARTAVQGQATVEALDAQLAAARARLAEARTERSLAEKELERATALVRNGFVSRATIDRLRASRDRARASAEEAAQMLDATGHNLQSARAALVTGNRSGQRGIVAITSPVSGYVLQVPQESARAVVAGTPLVEVGDPERLEMVTDLLSSDAARVRAGAAARIEDWGGDRPLHGRVRLVEPFGFTKISALGVEEQRVNVVIDFADPRSVWSSLGHGYRGTVKIDVWSAPDVLQVPVGALFRSGGRWSVFVAGAGNRAELRAVRIGHVNADVAEVLAGLSENEKVLLHPSDKVAAGVRIAPAHP